MIIALITPFVASAVFGLMVSRAARQLPPRLALWVLTGGAAILAGSTSIALGTIVATRLAQWSWLGRVGRWSTQSIARSAPFGGWPSALAAAVVIAVAASVLVVALREGRRLARAWSASRAAPSSLVVLPDAVPLAYAVPGWPGRVVTSVGLLRSLDSTGRRALLAHEQAHLDQHHDLHLVVGKLAAAANPLLRLAPAAIRLACERCADERAAGAVGSRSAVAAAITRVASPATAGLLLFSAGGADVPVRIQALLAGTGFRGRLPLAVLVVTSVLALAASAWAYRDLDRIFDAAAWSR